MTNTYYVWIGNAKPVSDSHHPTLASAQETVQRALGNNVRFFRIPGRRYPYVVSFAVGGYTSNLAEAGTITCHKT